MKAQFEKVDFQEGSSISVFEVEDTHFQAPWHFHPEYELTYIEKSNGIRYVGNNISDFGAGDLVLLGPNLPHCWINENNLDNSAKALVIHWTDQLVNDIPEYRLINELFKSSQRGIKFDEMDTGKEIELLYKIKTAGSISRLILLLELLDQLSRRTDSNLLAGSSYQSDLSLDSNHRISTIQQFVRDNFQEKVKLSDVASQLNMTEQSFSRFFSKIMQRPFFVFLNEFRCNIASRMLLETDLQVSEIGYNCGYDSLPFFYKQFRKFKKHSPSDFRKLYRNIQ